MLLLSHIIRSASTRGKLSVATLAQDSHRGARCTSGGRELGKKELAKRNNSLLYEGLEVANFERVNNSLMKRKILGNFNSDPSHMTTPG